MGDEDVEFQDVFLQWKPAVGLFNAGDSSVVEETEVLTGLTMFGEKMWALHEVELYRGDAEELVSAAFAVNDDELFRYALGKPGLTDIDPDVPGVIAHFRGHVGWKVSVDGAGGIHYDDPLVWRPATPIPIAAYRLAVYAHTETDRATARSTEFIMRLGFTMMPTTPTLWRELAERWVSF